MKFNIPAYSLKAFSFRDEKGVVLCKHFVAFQQQRLYHTSQYYVNWFLSMKDAQDKIEQWRWEYNTFRPHSSLNDLTPEEVFNEHDKTSRFST
jgi:transposase InsO family protein